MTPFRDPMECQGRTNGGSGKEVDTLVEECNLKGNKSMNLVQDKKDQPGTVYVCRSS